MNQPAVNRPAKVSHTPGCCPSHCQDPQQALRHSPFSRHSCLFYFAFKMRLIVLCLGHGKTQKDRFGISEGSSTGGLWHPRHPGVAHGPGGSAAGLGANDLEGSRQSDGRRAGDGGSAPEPVSASQRSRATDCPKVGRAAAGTPAVGGRAGLFVCLETQGRARPTGGGHAPAGGSGRKAWPPHQALGGLSAAGSASLAQSCPRYSTPQGPACGSGRVEKKRFPKSWRPC